MAKPAPATDRRRPPPARRRVQPPAARPRGRSPKPVRKPKVRRFVPVYDIDGPKVRLGIGWFALNIAALVVGVVGVAVLYAAAAALAARQSAEAWRHRHQRPDPLVAAVIAGALPLAAALTTALLGIAVLVGAAVAVGIAFGRGSRQPLADAGFTVQCSLFAGLAAAGVVVTARYELSAAVALVLLVAAYEVGDFLIGSGSTNAIEGPLAGITALAVITFCVGAVGNEPLTFPDVFWFGALAAAACPLGQLAASAILPARDAPASALRRIDSLLLLAPLWAFLIGHIAAT